MTQLTGLFSRGSSYYLRVVLPKGHPITPQYRSGKVVISLGCCSRRDAIQRGLIKRGEILGNLWVPAEPPGKAKKQPTLETRQAQEPQAIPYLRDVYLRWGQSKPRTADTMRACERALALFEEFSGNPSVIKVSRSQGDGFRSWLQHPDRKTTSKTARDRLTWVKSLFKYAQRDLGLISNSPWEGLDICAETTSPRRPWTDPELQLLFNRPLHTAYALPKDGKAGSDAAYWIPILGLYSGARVSELAQLHIGDVVMAAEGPFLSITDEGAGQSVKSAAGLRKVPIHSELIRLGFMDYVQAQPGEKFAPLWPTLRVRSGKPGGYFSQWFGEYRRSLGFQRHPDFHCLRHTVRNQLAEAEVPEQVIDSIIGHEVKGSTGAKVYTHRSLKIIRAAVEKLTYPALRLESVYRDAAR